MALIAFAQAWINPELYAFRGASVLRPKGARHERSEPVAQGLLGDLLDHDERDIQRDTGVALQRGSHGHLDGGGGRAPSSFRPAAGAPTASACGSPTRDLPPSDRIAHLLLALRTDEQGFATVGNHAFCGASWRVRRRLPKPMRPALDAARTLANQPR